MKAPVRFVAWLQDHRHVVKSGRVYQYHSRSDAHSIVLCEMILQDIIDDCVAIRQHGLEGKIAYGINLPYKWPLSQKSKTIDLAIGTPESKLPKREKGIEKVDSLKTVLVSCEAKAVMTEHKKSQPRIFDELSSSHEIVHRGNSHAIAAGVTVVNIASRFVSPLRQKNCDLVVTLHKQPQVAESMIEHLRGLGIRNTIEEQGFDAYTTIVVNCENQVDRPVTLHSDTPAPQQNDVDHYDSFLRRICQAYTARFNSLP